MFPGNPRFEQYQKMFPQSATGQPVKRKRILLTLAKKVEVLDSLAAGGTFASVAKQFNLNDSTVRTIKQAEQSIRHSARYGCDTSNNIMFASRAPCIEMMETKVNEWITQQTAKGSRVSNREITDTAKRIFSEVKTPGDGTVFMASNTWLFNFKKRFPVQISAPSINPQEILDNEAAETYKIELKTFIDGEGYAPEQVFNIGEDVLYWKRLPTVDLKTFPEKLTVLFCCNASGDFMSKPMIVHRSLHPRSMSAESLPVFWRANTRYAITDIELNDWYLECFLPSVSEYLASKSLPFKVLLLMDNEPKYASLENKGIENVNIRLLPPRTKNLLQPLSQGIFAAFKRYYLRRMLSQLSQNMFLNPALKLLQSWRVFSMANGVEIIRDAIDEISASDINACWKTLWPEVVHEYSTLPSEQIEIEEILQVIREINDPACNTVKIKDIAQILGSSEFAERDTNQKAQKSLDNTANTDIEFKMVEDSSEFIIQNEADDPAEVMIQNNDIQTEIPPLVMPLESLNQIFASANALEQVVLRLDPSISRSMKFSEELEELLRPYKEEMTKQGG